MSLPSKDIAWPVAWGAIAALLAGAVALQVGAAPAAAAAAAAAAAGLTLAAGLRRPLRRARAAQGRLPEAARDWLRAHVRLYQTADAAARARFEAAMLVALAELRFEAAGGVELTDELRWAVAAGAAVLLHGRPDWTLPAGRTILFLPDSFDDQYATDDDPDFAGMVHAQGPVVLAAPAVRLGWARADGYNVVLHELAHLFDFDGAFADGVPAFLDARSVDAWQALVREEMRRARLGKGVLSRYASTAPAELFAVATEQFFERPLRLRRHHPALYDALRAFYNYDPPDEAEPEPAPSLMARRRAG